jgi:hypothetical protein
MKDMSDDYSFGLVYDKSALANLITERDAAAKPDALALGGGDLVADALANHFALEHT